MLILQELFHQQPLKFALMVRDLLRQERALINGVSPFYVKSNESFFSKRKTYLSLKFFHVLTIILPILAISRFRPYVDTVIIILCYSDVLLYFQGGCILGFHRGFWLQRTHCIDFLLKRKSPVVATVQILDIKASLSLSIGTVLLQVWQVGEVEMGGGSVLQAESTDLSGGWLALIELE